jgi:CubicO group peptidase (beta-lactamase class C family)
MAAAALLWGGGALWGCGAASLADERGLGDLAPERMKAITTSLQDAVERGDVGGVVTLIYRRGEIARVDAVGWQDEARTKPMARDSIFRIASTTKPITSVAALILVDEGKLARSPFGAEAGDWKGQGFGLGLAVKDDTGMKARELGIASPGSFGWPGVFGTWWEADPKQDMILIFMVPGGDSKPTRWAFQAGAYQAIEH